MTVSHKTVRNTLTASVVGLLTAHIESLPLEASKAFNSLDVLAEINRSNMRAASLYGSMYHGSGSGEASPKSVLYISFHF